jgi:hypothetical protein
MSNKLLTEFVSGFAWGFGLMLGILIVAGGS